jgi:two-component system, sporulation sensor kinase A
MYLMISAAKGGVFILLSAIFLYQMLKKSEQLQKQQRMSNSFLR